MALIRCTPKGFDEARERLQHIASQESSEQANPTVLEQLHAEALELISHARANGAYTDQTSNLRSSIGCGIYFNGKLVETLTASEGTAKGKAAAESAVQQWALDNPQRIALQGYTIVLVAGMSYGVHVENKGYNVLFLTVTQGESDMIEIKRALRQARLI